MSGTYKFQDLLQDVRKSVQKEHLAIFDIEMQLDTFKEALKAFPEEDTTVMRPLDDTELEWLYCGITCLLAELVMLLKQEIIVDFMMQAAPSSAITYTQALIFLTRLEELKTELFQEKSLTPC